MEATNLRAFKKEMQQAIIAGADYVHLQRLVQALEAAIADIETLLAPKETLTNEE